MVAGAKPEPLPSVDDALRALDASLVATPSEKQLKFEPVLEALGVR